MRSARVTPNTVGSPSDYNSLLGDAAGAASLLVHQMYGTIALPTNPTNGQTVTATINGTPIVLTAVASISGAAAGSFLIAGTAALTLANLIQLLLNPTITNSTQVAIGVNTSANVTLVNYINWSASGTNLVASSFNSTLYSPASSFSASTTVTGGSYTANTMALYVEPGIFYIAGTRVIFGGGVTPTITAPSSHPRIDVLSINSSGTLSWTTGTENASPSAPTYPNPASNLVLCELYNVVSETALYDNANQTSSQGYIYNDVRQFQQPSMSWGAFPANLIPDADGTRDLGSSGTEWNHVYVKTAVIVNGQSIASARFGGTGASGALTQSSGTTTVSASNAAYLELNYSSVSLTGTANLTFSNPATNGTLVVVRSQGNLTVTSSATPAIDVISMGPAGGTAGSGSNSNGNTGTTSVATTGVFLLGANGGIGGVSGAGGAPAALAILISNAVALTRTLAPGTGGGAGGGAAAGAGGVGGRGSGALIIECAGSYNVTGTISAAGTTGGTAGNGSGGGGGGGGGCILILYNSLTTNSGTYTITGGSGGLGQSSGGGGTSGGGGGGGNSAVAQGTTGGAGNNGTSTGGTGGTGANGFSLIVQNTYYA